MSRLPLRPIDDSVRDGRMHVLSNGDVFGLVRWNGEDFEFASGLPITFVPIGFYRPERADA